MENILYEELNKLLLEIDFSGVVTIKKDDEILYNEARGYRDRANKLLNNTSTSFGIASGTKLFTALGIMMLVESERLSLEDYVFDIIDKPYQSYDSKVTIKHLLTHTSGLPDYYDEDFIEDFENFKLDVPWFELRKPSDYKKIMPNRDMKSIVGETFNYNNSAFVFLAMIIEKITGDYHKWITDEIINKHNMSHTGFYFMDNMPGNCANGYLDADSFKTNIFKLPIVGGGDGGLFTCTDDLLILWKSYINGNIINKELVEQTLTPHLKEENSYYGLGVWLKEDGGNYLPYIVGQDPGVSFMSGYNNYKNIIFNILSNTDDGAWEVAKLVKEIIYRV